MCRKRRGQVFRITTVLAVFALALDHMVHWALICSLPASGPLPATQERVRPHAIWLAQSGCGIFPVSCK